MAKPNIFKNKLGANIEIVQLRGNSFNYYYGCTIDIKINVYSDDLSRKYSFWLLNHDTGWDGDDIMDGIYESELECNEDFCVETAESAFDENEDGVLYMLGKGGETKTKIWPRDKEGNKATGIDNSK